MRHAAAVTAVLILLPLYHPAAIHAQTAPASQPATAEDVARLRKSIEELRAQLAALNRRLDAIEEQLNSIQK